MNLPPGPPPAPPPPAPPQRRQLTGLQKALVGVAVVLGVLFLAAFALVAIVLATCKLHFP